MEINFCEEVVTVSNKTGRITLTEEEIERLASLVRDFNADRLERSLKEFRDKYGKVVPPRVYDITPKWDDFIYGKIGGPINETRI